MLFLWNMLMAGTFSASVYAQMHLRLTAQISYFNDRFSARITAHRLINWLLNPLECLFSIEGYVALDRNPEPEYDTLLLRLIRGDLYSACSHNQFHTLPGLFAQSDCTATPPPQCLCAKQWGSLYHFYNGFWCDPTGTRTHDLSHGRRKRMGVLTQSGCTVKLPP